MLAPNPAKRRTAVKTWLHKEWSQRKYLYLMALPIIAYFAIFKYAPMYGVVMAFKRFNPRQGILGSPWVGLAHFQSFFNSFYAWRVIRNTFLISLFKLLWGFPIPIIFALFLNEVRHDAYKRLVQTITYMPYFISLVVICGLIKDFLSTGGILNNLITVLGGPDVNLMIKPEAFRTIYVASDVWQGMGFSSIIYLAAISGVDMELYEAAAIDGITSRIKQAIYITIPSILPTIIILLILNIGQLMNLGFEKVLLLYNDSTRETADIISTFVYRVGLQESNYGYAAAVGLFNSVINCALVVAANWISGRVSDTSLW